MAEPNYEYQIFYKTIQNIVEKIDIWQTKYYNGLIEANDFINERLNNPEKWIKQQVNTYFLEDMTRQGENIIHEIYNSLQIDIKYAVVYEDKNGWDRLSSFGYLLTADPFKEDTTSIDLRVSTNKLSQNKDVKDINLESALSKYQKNLSIKADISKGIGRPIKNQKYKDLQKLALSYIYQIETHQKQLLDYYYNAKKQDLLSNTGIYNETKNLEEGLPRGLFGNLKEVLLSLLLTERHSEQIYSNLYNLLDGSYWVPWQFKGYEDKKKKTLRKKFLKGASEIQNMIKKDNNIFFATGDFSYAVLNNYLLQKDRQEFTTITKTQNGLHSVIISPLNYYYYNKQDEENNNIPFLLSKKEQYQIKAMNASQKGKSVYNVLKGLKDFLQNDIKFNQTDQSATICGYPITLFSLEKLGEIFADPKSYGSTTDIFFNKVRKNISELLEKYGFKEKDLGPGQYF